MKELFYQYNPWWESDYVPPDYFARPKFEEKIHNLMNNQSIILLTGLRRVGKTTLLKRLVPHLLEQGVSRRHIFYVSMDDYQLLNDSIIDIITAYRKLHRLSVDEKIYLLFDEITYKKDFRLQLKNLYDKGNVKIFASSSSASALRDNKGFLTGRERIIEILPLDFNEFLHFSKVNIKNRDAALLESYFEEYMQIGGMPEYVITRDRGYLTELVNDILYKDIIAYHSIKSPHVIQDYLMLLMERVGKQISLSKIANILNISVDSSKRYLQMFVDCYLIYLVPRYGKTNQTILSHKKVYAADVGIKNLLTGFRDKGAIFENLIFQTIKEYSPCYVYQDSIEIDFLTTEDYLIESKYGQTLNPKQQKLFDEFPATKKKVIANFQDFMALL